MLGSIGVQVGELSRPAIVALVDAVLLHHTAVFVDSSAGGLKSQTVYTAVGVVMVVCGALLILVGYVQHRKVAHILSAAGEDDLPLSRWPQMVTIVSVLGAALLATLIGASG